MPYIALNRAVSDSSFSVFTLVAYVVERKKIN